MPNSVTKRSSRIAILAVVSVIASLFTFAALPASAATGDVEAEATWSACVNAATEDAGFTDTTGHFADAWIDCIGHYGITIGTSATTYSPGQAVTRAQMALFLTRAAGPVGISVPAATDQGFTDIAGLPQTYQDAINQLAAMDITKGTSATTYGPNDTVARYQMALFLNRFLAKAGVTFDGNSSSGFTDIGAVSFEAHNAIEDVYDFGITTGTTATTYAPFAAVNRGQMAAFIGRMLGHTNARPAGISFQAESLNVNETTAADFQVSVRDASFNPVVDALVDVFQIATANVANAFNADGTCTGNVSATVGGTACSIALTEPVQTAADGNTEFSSAGLSAPTTFWAWTGAAGATFDADTTVAARLDVTTSAVATKWVVTSSLPANTTDLASPDGNLAKYGTSVTHTFQLAEADGTAVAQAGVSLTIRISVEVDTVLTSSTTVSGTTDATGAVSFTLPTQSDPSTTVGNQTRVDVDYISSTGPAVPANVDESKLPNTEEDVVFTDAASVETLLVAASVNDWLVASDAGTGTVNTVTGTLYDQYGLGLSGRTVAFTSDNGEGIGATAVNRTTNSAGVATLGYARDSAATGIETVTTSWNALTDTTSVYWVDATPADATYAIAAVDLLIVEKDTDTVVVLSGGVYYAFTWDAGDQFRVVGAPSTQAAFETALTVTDALSIVFDADGVSAFDITTNNA